MDLPTGTCSQLCSLQVFVTVRAKKAKSILQSPRLVHLSSVKDSLMERYMSEAIIANEIHSPSHIKFQPLTNWLFCVASKREVAKADKGRPKQAREAKADEGGRHERGRRGQHERIVMGRMFPQR